MRDEIRHDCLLQVLQTATVLWRESRRFFRPFGLTEAQFNVLNLVAKHPSGLSQRELGDLMIVDRSNITLLVDRMQKKGWIRRMEVPEDRRAYRLLLTPKGLDVWKKVNPKYLTAIEAATRNLKESSLSITMEALKQLEAQANHWRIK